VILAWFVVERNLRVWKGIWPLLAAGVLEPLLYLLVLGVGVGGLVGDVATAGGSVPYADFVAPGLLASSAMNAAVFETFNVYFKLYDRLYDAMAATPATPAAIAAGEVGWAVLRAALYAAGFVAAMGLLGLLASPWALLAVPAAVLIGFAFAATTLVATTFMRSWNDFDLLQLVVVPLFLFSATFFPLQVLPGWAQGVAVLSPLYHGVVVVRDLTLGLPSASTAGHAALLLALGVVGLVVGGRRFATLLRR
jgi:lipooligosaccharide transport system permease protein